MHPDVKKALIAGAVVAVMMLTFYAVTIGRQKQITLTSKDYTKENPFIPKKRDLADLKDILPRHPAHPPMQEYTQAYQARLKRSYNPPGLFKYYLYVPENYDPQYHYPAVMLLHGQARHMTGGAEYFRHGFDKTEQAFVIVPIAPPKYDWVHAAPLAMEALDEVRAAYNINPNRIYLSGYSMGGIGTYAMLYRYHDIFAGAFVVCGMWDVDAAGDLDDIPLAVFHATEDETFPIGTARHMVKTLEDLGRTVRYIEQKGASNTDCIRPYQNKVYWDWLFAQAKSQAAPRAATGGTAP
jgi:predicted esterase